MWCILQIRDALRARRAAPPTTPPSHPVTDMIDIRGLDDDAVRAIMIARTLRTGRTTFGRIDDNGQLHMRDAELRITMPDDGSGKRHMN